MDYDHIAGNPVAYFEQRMEALGIRPDMLHIELYYDSLQNAAFHNFPLKRKAYRIFEPNDKGIGILLYSIEKEVHWFRSSEGKQKVREYRQTRLLHPVHRGGSLQKYYIPKGQPALPFFPPLLLDYYGNGTTIDTLFLTEGHLKAFKACMHGVFCVGLPSITCMKDADGLLYPDILKLIHKCGVRNVVWLMDGDCRNISAKEITQDNDLARRPDLFYRSVTTFSDLLSQEPVRVYTAWINSEQLKGQPKGIDDLLCSLCPEDIDKVAAEANDFRVQKAGVSNGTYFTRFEITRSCKLVYSALLLDDVTAFYLYHCRLRPELKGAVFQFFGRLFRYDEEQGVCIPVKKEAALEYFRVGDQYYQHICLTDEYGVRRSFFEKRERKTIYEDHGKDIFPLIPKYIGFVNVPSHTAYQQVINHCVNIYQPLSWTPEPGSCDRILAFFRHIFGTEEILLDAGDPASVCARWELGLDYIQLLYLRPAQILPILCLVSRKRQTGKTTWCDLINAIFQDNMIVVSNNDLKGDFNAHWQTKLIVAADETKIESDIILERIKSVSTARTAVVNAKGKDQRSARIYTKFIMNSNREEDFIRIDSEEIRFWVIKVPALPGLPDVGLLESMIAEIPAFLYFLQHRSIRAPQRERHWFESRILVTKALKKLVAAGTQPMMKQLQVVLSELFDCSGMDIIHLPLSEIASLLRVHNKSFVSDLLRRMGYKTFPAPGIIYFPRIVEQRTAEGSALVTVEQVRFKGRYYTFHAAQIINNPDEDNNENTGNGTEAA